MGNKNKIIRVTGLCITLILISAIPVTIVTSVKKSEKKDIDWIDITELTELPDLSETTEETAQIEAYAGEPVILTRSSNIEKKSPRSRENKNPESSVSEESVTVTIDGNEIKINVDDSVPFEEIEPTVTADELVKWAFRAYYEEWEYVYGGCEEGHVDCSGLIKSKVEVCARGTEELLAESAVSGSIETIPDIPGLGVYTAGHVGIYVGDGMVIDARTEASGIGYDTITYETWTDWFEIRGVDYSRYVNSGSE